MKLLNVLWKAGRRGMSPGKERQSRLGAGPASSSKAIALSKEAQIVDLFEAYAVAALTLDDLLREVPRREAPKPAGY